MSIDLLEFYHQIEPQERYSQKKENFPIKQQWEGIEKLIDWGGAF